MNWMKKTFRRFMNLISHQTYHGTDFIIISKKAISEYPESNSIKFQKILKDLRDITAMQYPGRWFQVIIRNKKGQFRRYRHHKKFNDRTQQKLI